MKYWTSPEASGCRCWHAKEDCQQFKADPVIRDESFVEWHELEPCPVCAETDHCLDCGRPCKKPVCNGCEPDGVVQ